METVHDGSTTGRRAVVETVTGTGVKGKPVHDESRRSLGRSKTGHGNRPFNVKFLVSAEMVSTIISMSGRGDDELYGGFRDLHDGVHDRYGDDSVHDGCGNHPFNVTFFVGITMVL